MLFVDSFFFHELVDLIQLSFFDLLVLCFCVVATLRFLISLRVLRITHLWSMESLMSGVEGNLTSYQRI